MPTTILIVVEHDYLRETLEMWLGLTFPKCNIRAVINESEAIALALIDPPQLIVIDAGLPEAKSFDAIKYIKDVLPTTPVLVLTSYESEIHRSHAIACGATACFRKDAILTELQPTVEALLASSPESNESEQKRMPEIGEWQTLQPEF